MHRARPGLPGLEPARRDGRRRDLGDAWSAFGQVAEKHGVSPQQVCLAWELSLSDAVIPIPGASRPASVADSAPAADLVLDDEDLALLA